MNFFVYLILIYFFYIQISFAEYSSDWISLKNLSKNEIINRLSEARNTLNPLLLDHEKNQEIAKKIEKDIRKSVRIQSSFWQTNFEKIFKNVSSFYQKKMHLEEIVHLLKINIQRLDNKISGYNEDIQDRKKIIINARALKNQILKESLSTLKNIPFYVVLLNSMEFNNNVTYKEAEEAIWNYVRPLIVEYIKGAFIRSETQVIDNELIKEKIEFSVVGRTSVESSNNRPFVEAISGYINRVTLTGLVAVYPWQNQSETESISQVIQVDSLKSIFIDNTNQSQLNVYPSFFVKEVLDLIQKSKSLNITYKNKFRQFISETNAHIKQKDQLIALSEQEIKNLKEEQQFYQNQKNEQNNKLQNVNQNLFQITYQFQKANNTYRAYLEERTNYQFQLDLALDDYNSSPNELYNNLLEQTFDRYRTNIRDEYLSWIYIVDSARLEIIQKTKKQIPNLITKAKILYSYVKNNPQEGRPTRGIIVVYVSKFVLKNIPDFQTIQLKLEKEKQKSTLIFNKECTVTRLKRMFEYNIPIKMISEKCGILE